MSNAEHVAFVFFFPMSNDVFFDVEVLFCLCSLNRFKTFQFLLQW